MIFRQRICGRESLNSNAAMGSFFVTADGEHGFSMRDGHAQLWLRLLALHIPEPINTDSEAMHLVSHQIRDQWLLASKGFFNGCVPSGMKRSRNAGRPKYRSYGNSIIACVARAPTARPIQRRVESAGICLRLDEKC